jgi:hypothetical protein
VNKASVIRRSVAGVGLGLAGVYAYNVARYRRAADEGFDLPHPLAVGSHEFAGLIEVLARAPRRVGGHRRGAGVHRLFDLYLLVGRHRPAVRRRVGYQSS